MSDHIYAKDKDGNTIIISAKDLAGILFPRSIITDPSGVEQTLATQTTLAAIEAKLPALVANGLRMAGYDPGDDMLKVKSVQKKWRDSFVGASLNAAKWDSSIGTGGAITVGSGVLTMGSGTTANADTYVLSKETFTIPFRANIGLTLSQRIANQTFAVEAISVDSVTGVPDGLHTVGLVFDGTSATLAKYRVQNSGASPLVSAASTFPTTANAGFYELEPFADECWFHGGTLDSNTGRTNSYRRHQQIPEPNAVFKIRLRWLNGASAPASNTNAVIQYISVQDYAELTAEITAGRGQSVAGQGIGVNVIGTVPVSGTLTANIGTSGSVQFTDSSTALAASAAYTGTSRDASTSSGYNLFTANAFADQAGTLEIQKSIDGSTWRRAASIAVAAGEGKELTVRCSTRYHRVVFSNGSTLQTAFLLTSAYQRM